jgi:hypothetical protein
VFSKLKTTDGDYSQLVETRTQRSSDIFTLAQGDATLNKLMQDYVDSVNDVHDKETDVMYAQGMKDCLTLLKLLGTI